MFTSGRVREGGMTASLPLSNAIAGSTNSNVPAEALSMPLERPASPRQKTKHPRKHSLAALPLLRDPRPGRSGVSCGQDRLSSQLTVGAR